MAKMAKSMTKIASLAIVVAVLVSTMLVNLVGCDKKSDKAQWEEAYATAVDYSSDGIYTTSVSRVGGDWDGVGKNDIKVKYTVPAENADDPDIVKEAEVLGATAGTDGMLNVIFSDSDADDDNTDRYVLFVEKLSVAAVVDVEFATYTATCDKQYVLSTDKNLQLTLTLNDGEFAADVSKDDVALAGSFEDLTVESVSAAGGTLTALISGNISKHETAGVYLDGIIRLAADAVENNVDPIADIRIPVNEPTTYFDSSRTRFANGKVNVPIVLMGVADPDTLNTEDIVFDEQSGITVENVVPVSDDEIFVVLNVDGATDRNSAAKILNGATVNVKNTEIIAQFAPAAFYPVFDHVEQQGSNFLMSVVLYAKNGKFAEDLDKEKVSLGGEFEGATITSLTRESDEIATLGFTVPANGKTTDALDLDGEIILAQGSLVNAWGDGKDDDTSYMRNYSLDSLGRGVTIQKVVSVAKDVADFTNELRKLLTGQKNVCEAVSWICGCFGQFSSSDSYAANFQKEVYKKLDSILDLVQANNELLTESLKQSYSSQLRSFDVAVNKLESACNTLDSYLTQACKNTGISTNDLKNKSDSDATQVAKRLVDDMKTKKNYVDTLSTLKSDFNTVVGNLKLSGQTNPFAMFDKLCTISYNFDTQCKDMRENYRARAEYMMGRAVSHLMMYYVYGDNDPNAKNTYQSDFNAVTTAKNNNPVNSKDGAAYSYVMYRYFNLSRFSNVHIFPVYQDNWRWGDELRAGRGIKEDFDFNESERNNFISRMQGRTLRQELELAGFTGFDYNGRVGMAFWVARQKSSANFGESVDELFYPSHAKNRTEYYAIYMLWDWTGQTKRGKVYGDFNDTMNRAVDPKLDEAYYLALARFWEC